MNTNYRQLTIEDIEVEPHFDGQAYDKKFDHERLTGQLKRIYS